MSLSHITAAGSADHGDSVSVCLPSHYTSPRTPTSSPLKQVHTNRLHDGCSSHHLLEGVERVDAVQFSQPHESHAVVVAL
ncbi:unnamed protein product [Boreogadus saida]